jgi:predicted nucleic acid-binding Zn ribbon protein
MPLQDRICLECSYEEDDCLESIHTNDVIQCPVCLGVAFKKKVVRSTFTIDGRSTKNGWD